MVHANASRVPHISEPLAWSEICECYPNQHVYLVEVQRVAQSRAIAFRDRAKKARFAVVVEVQRHIEDFKRFSWPTYVAAARAIYRCPTLLLIIAFDPKIAAWAEASIDLGHPGFVLRPIVISQRDVPMLKDADLARRLPELAVLSALAHGSPEIARLALSVLDSLSADYRRVYHELIVSKLPVEAQREMEKKMFDDFVYTSDFAVRHLAQGRKEGIEIGILQGEEIGEKRGMRAGGIAKLQEVAAMLVRSKLGDLTSLDATILRSISDEAALSDLVAALVVADSEDQVRSLISNAARKLQLTQLGD